MTLGLGIDIVDNRRLERWVTDDRLLGRFFHGEELAALDARGGNRVTALAARFAAKEAFCKALGTGFSGIRLKEIRVMNDERGKPEIVLEGSALELFRENGGKRIFLSLSHEKDFSIASVLIEG